MERVLQHSPDKCTDPRLTGRDGRTSRRASHSADVSCKLLFSLRFGTVKYHNLRYLKITMVIVFS